MNKLTSIIIFQRTKAFNIFSNILYFIFYYQKKEFQARTLPRSTFEPSFQVELENRPPTVPVNPNFETDARVLKRYVRLTCIFLLVLLLSYVYKNLFYDLWCFIFIRFLYFLWVNLNNFYSNLIANINFIIIIYYYRYHILL